MTRIILHTADLHIGKNRKYGDYLEQQQFMLEGILRITEDTLREHQASEVWLIVAGDIFDRNEDTLREEFVLFMSHFLFPLLNLKEKYANFSYYIIDGNHDRQPYIEHPSVLSAFQPLTPYLSVRDPLFFQKERLLLVPFGGYSEASFKELLKKYPCEFIVAHECLSRMVTDTGWTPPRDQDHGYIEINNVVTPEIAGVFLGDIHKCQALDDAQRVWYSGSPTTLDHGHKLPKGVLRHIYKQGSDGRWVQDRLPELLPLEDSRIKQHFQLGRILSPDQVPLGQITDLYRKHYVQMTIAPEVYQVLDTQFPDFFTSTLTNWEFDRGTEAVAAVSSVVDVEPSVSLEDYYKPLIEHWLTDNAEHLASDERAECLDMLLTDFRSRS